MKFQDKSHWTTVKIRDIAKLSQGLQIAIDKREIKPTDSNYFYITHEFLKNNNGTKYYISNPSKSVICYEDDLLMTRTGNTGQIVTGVSGVFHNNFFKIAYTDSIFRMYLYYILTSNKYQYTILKLAGSSTIPDLNHGDFYNIPIPLPPLEEQKEIAHILSKQDEYIDKLNQLIQAKEKNFLGLIQTLISEPTKNGQWATALLSDVADIVMGQSPSSQYYTSNPNHTVLIQGNADIQNGIIIPRVYTTNITKHCEIGDIIMSVRAPVGDIAITKFDACIGRGVCAIRSNNHYIQSFLVYVMLLLRLNGAWKSLSTGSIFESINSNEIRRMPVPLPTLEEQERIANILSIAQSEISKLKELKSKHQQQKLALMQEIFG